METRDDVYAGADLCDAEIDAAKKWLAGHAREDGTLPGCTSYLQRKMLIPYGHAQRIVDYLEAAHFVSERASNATRKLIALPSGIKHSSR